MQKFNIILATLIGFFFSMIGTAHAALPTSITDPTSGVFATIEADILSLANDYMWPLLAVVLGLWILVDVVKKGVKKSTK